MRNNGKKGFTLAELLVVVAIIGVLVAIAIPVFSSAMDGAILARDSANVRAVYGELVVGTMSLSKQADREDYISTSTVDDEAVYTYFSEASSYAIEGWNMRDCLSLEMSAGSLAKAFGAFDCTLDYVVPLTPAELALYEGSSADVATLCFDVLRGRDIKVVSPAGGEVVIPVDDDVAVWLDEIICE